jgi:hypothetical protein
VWVSCAFNLLVWFFIWKSYGVSEISHAQPVHGKRSAHIISMDGASRKHDQKQAVWIAEEMKSSLRSLNEKVVCASDGDTASNVCGRGSVRCNSYALRWRSFVRAYTPTAMILESQTFRTFFLAWAPGSGVGAFGGRSSMPLAERCKISLKEEKHAF